MPRRTHTAARPVRSAGRHAPPARPRRALGQNFLHDEEVLDRIIREGGFGPEETVLEVGGGTGQLTEPLARAVGRVVSVELDETLSGYLRRRMEPYPNTTVINANVLDFTPVEVLAEAGVAPPYVMAGNIPYYITAPILRRFLTTAQRPRRMVMMMQREVAESLAAGPGDMTLLGVSVQVYGDPRVLFRVPRTAFKPAPKVDSAVLRVDVYPRPAITIDEEEFFKVVRAGFRRPRKQLHNALGAGLWLPPGGASSLLDDAHIDPMRRAQTLCLGEWEALTRAYLALKTTFEGDDAERERTGED